MKSFDMIAVAVGVYLLRTVSSAASSDCRNVWGRCWDLITYDITNCEKANYQQNCKRTCGLCGVCTDLREDCNHHIMQCSKPWMQVSCRKTCGTCVDEETGQGVGEETSSSPIWTTARAVLDMGSFRFWIIYVIILLVLLFIGVLVVFIIIRLRGSRRKSTAKDKNLSAKAADCFNIEIPVCLETAAGVSMGSPSASEMPETFDLFNNSAALKSPDKQDLVHHETNTSNNNEKSKSFEQIQENEERSLYQHTGEARPSTTQTVTVKKEGLLYTELDFTQCHPQTKRPLPQKEETNYEAIEFKLKQ